MKVQNVRLRDIAHVENSRGEITGVQDLMQSIQEVGLLQPLVICKNFTDSKNPYLLVAGNRRYNALNKLDIGSAPCLISDSIKTLDDLIIVNMTENMQREDVTVYEQGRLIYRLVSEFDYSPNEVAVKLGANLNRVNSMLDIFKDTPVEFRDDVVLKTPKRNSRSTKTIPLAAANQINSIRRRGLLSRIQTKKVYQDVKDGKLNSDDIKTLAKQLNSGVTITEYNRIAKKIVTVQIKVPLYVDEKQYHIDKGDFTEHLQKLVYGETKDSFTRPRFK